MEISKATVGVIAALCVAAGAGGAYMVSGGSRVTAVPEAEEVATTDTSPQAPAPTTIDQAASAPATSRPAAAPKVAAPAAAARPAAAPTSPAPPRPPQPPVASTPTETADGTSGQWSPAQPSDTQVAAAILEPEPFSPPDPEPFAEAEPPVPEFEDLVISADSVVGLEIETSTTSDHAEVEDEVVARVTRDVRVADKVAIPAGARAYGEVTLVERGGRLRERARLGVRFTSVVLTDGTRVWLDTEIIYREGDPPSRESAAKIGGGAIGGAILGSIFGGAKGAAIGGSVGAGAGTAAVLAGGRNAATLPSGTPVTVRLTEPTIVTVDRQ